MRHNFLKNFILNLIFAVCLLCKSVNGAALSENTNNELSNEQTPIILQKDKQLPHF